jgi:hypothetical protein
MQNIQRVRKLLDIDALPFPDPLLVGSKIAKLAAGVAHVRYGTCRHRSSRRTTFSMAPAFENLLIMSSQCPSLRQSS